MRQDSLKKSVRGRCIVLTVCAILPLAACGDDDPTGPSNGEGTMEAVVRDDGGAAGAPPSSPALTEGSGEVSGQFQGQARVQVQVDGVWQDVAGMTNVSAQTELRAGESTMGSAAVQAGTYDGVRVIVSNAAADVDAGSDFGVGPIDVSVSVLVGGGADVIVEYSQPITVQAGATTRLILDLNSHAWLTEGAVQAGAVTSAAFQGAAAIQVE